jgi:hypothetical protein
MTLFHHILSVMALAPLMVAAMAAENSRTIALNDDLASRTVFVEPDEPTVLIFVTTHDAAEIHWPATGITHSVMKSRPLRVLVQTTAGQRIAFTSAGFNGEIVAAKSESPAAKAAAPAATADVVSITADENGFHPDAVTIPLGRPTTLRFTREAEATCNDAVKIPELGLRKPRPLPYREAVDIVVTPERPGSYAFSCPMNMGTGTITVVDGGSDAR